MKIPFKYRMYFFVPYNISPIQQGIQAGHAAIEYAFSYCNSEEFKNFVKYDKTWIILNGGTTNDGHFGGEKGTMQEILEYLKISGINHSSFCEPDLNMALSAICFLADERVWDYENYPDFHDYVEQNSNESPQILIRLKLDRDNPDQQKLIFPDLFDQWVKTLGNYKNLQLRNLIRNKKLA